MELKLREYSTDCSEYSSSYSGSGNIKASTVNKICIPKDYIYINQDAVINYKLFLKHYSKKPYHFKYTFHTVC
jgi:hypothetical protein